MGLVLLCLIGMGVWLSLSQPKHGPAAPVPVGPVKPRAVPATTTQEVVVRASEASGSDAAASAAAVEEERHKEVDREHLRKLHAGLFAYKAKHGMFPEYLSQLVPEFVSADVLTSPRSPEQGMNFFAKTDHPDPGVEQPAYGFEFSNLEFRDGRTFAEIKEVQRAEWGDAVPILRAFGYDTVINMAYGGEIYETALNWEWDAATLDVVDKLGWGPGLTVGDTVRVLVAGPDGQPLANARVWADGRNYSFDLPNRPYATDADGYATIPVGADPDRTALRLRAEAPGLASPVAGFPLGSVPSDYAFQLAAAESVGGVAMGSDGQSLPYARVLLRESVPGAAGEAQTSLPLVAVRADENGRWQTSLHPDSVSRLEGVVAVPGGVPMTSSPGQPLPGSAAKAGTVAVKPPGDGG